MHSHICVVSLSINDISVHKYILQAGSPHQSFSTDYYHNSKDKVNPNNSLAF